METKKQLKVIEYLFDETKKDEGVNLISFVTEPAIEMGFIYFNTQKQLFKTKIDIEHKMATGPIMIPNKRIIRQDSEDTDPYFVYFSPETILKISQKYLIDKNNDKTNIEHNLDNEKTDGVALVESWIVEDNNNDKSKALGFENIPNGTWMGSYKINNENLWENIKSGKITGFSIQGFFNNSIVRNNDVDNLYEKIINLYKKHK